MIVSDEIGKWFSFDQNEERGDPHKDSTGAFPTSGFPFSRQTHASS